MKGNSHCEMCAEQLGDVRVECIECGVGYCADCAEESLKAGVCPRCRADNPVFYDEHSRTPGEVNKEQGETR